MVFKIWHLRAGYPASNLKIFLKQGATRIVFVYVDMLTPLLTRYIIININIYYYEQFQYQYHKKCIYKLYNKYYRY